MSLAEEYRRQSEWRDWALMFELLPPLQGQFVLDLGCGIGDQTAELAARGARVLGVDANAELLAWAKSRELASAEFIEADLRLLSLGLGMADGIWSSFTAAYFTDLAGALRQWQKWLRPGGWIALTEIDDFFAHEPVRPETRAALDRYVDDALVSGRYDFRSGRKLPACLEAAGFRVIRSQFLRDRELAFDGPASPGVCQAWRTRFERMTLLRQFFGNQYEHVVDDFLSCLQREDHQSSAVVSECFAVIDRG